MNEQYISLDKCPRCESNAFERLRTYGVCYDCNYSTEDGYSLELPKRRSRWPSFNKEIELNQPEPRRFSSRTTLEKGEGSNVGL